MKTIIIINLTFALLLSGHVITPEKLYYKLSNVYFEYVPKKVLEEMSTITIFVTGTYRLAEVYKDPFKQEHSKNPVPVKDFNNGIFLQEGYYDLVLKTTQEITIISGKIKHPPKK